MKDSNKKGIDGQEYISKKQAIKICNISYGVFDRICKDLHIEPTTIIRRKQECKYFNQNQISILCQFKKEHKSISHYLYGNPDKDEYNNKQKQIRKEIEEKGLLTKNGISKKLGIAQTTIEKIIKELNLQPIKLNNYNYYSKEQIIEIENFKKEHEPLKQYFYTKTCLEKYGVENVFLREDVKEKAVRNAHTKECIEKQKKSLDEHYAEYGGYSAYKSIQMKNLSQEEKDILQAKSKEGIFKKYGVDNVSKLEWVKEKKKESTLKTLGVEFPFQDVKLMQEGMTKKYGESNPSKIEYFNKKREETNLKRIGYRYLFQNPNVDKHLGRNLYILDDYKFDSSWELAYYIYLRDNNIPFKFHAMSIPYIYNDECHYYIPDFIVYDRIVEIKGDHLLEKNMYGYDKQMAKVQCMKENNVLILLENDIKPYIKYVKNKYGVNYLKECRVKRN